MSCDLTTAMKEIQVYLTSQDTPISVRNSPKIKKYLEDLLVLKNKLEDTGVRTPDYEVDNPLYMMYTNTPGSIDSYHKYGTVMKKVVDHIMEPIVVEDRFLLLKEVMKGNFNSSLVEGQYVPEDNTIRIAVTRPKLRNVRDAIIQGLEAEYHSIQDTTGISDENLQEFMGNDELYKKILKKAPKIEEDLLEVIRSLNEKKGSHAMLHEYIHAAASTYMQAHSESKEAKRIEDLYTYAMSKRNEISTYMTNGDILNEYWTRNSNEFLAEALSNPRLMLALSKLRAPDSMVKEGRLSGVLNELYDVVMSILGFKKDDSIYEYVLDGYVAMVEKQGELFKDGEGEAGNRLRGVEAIMANELDYIICKD